jgi:hypothetical protein
MDAITTSPRAVARFAGLLYLINAGCGLYAEVFVRGQTIAHGDAAKTAANILSRQAFFRSGFAADLVSRYCSIFCSGRSTAHWQRALFCSG